jgi:hypothetical protein
VVIRESANLSGVVAQLAQALAAPPRPITPEELAQLREKFSWASIVPAFYRRIARELQCRRCTPLLLEQSVEDVQRDSMHAKDFDALMERRAEEERRQREREGGDRHRRAVLES